MEIMIRQAVPADALDLHELAARTFGLANPADTKRADLDAFITAHLSQVCFTRYLEDPDRIVLVAQVQERLAPVGYSMLVNGPIMDPEIAAMVATARPDVSTAIELSKMYMDQEMHGSGAAATLMEATLEAAAKTGADACWLGVSQRSVQAAKFYSKYHFEIVGTTRFKIGEGWHDDHIRLRDLR